MKLIYESHGNGQHFQQFLVSEKETDDLITRRIKQVSSHDCEPGKVNTSFKTFKEQKFLCINGSQKNLRLTFKRGKEKKYIIYNCSQSRRPSQYPKAVLIQL